MTNNQDFSVRDKEYSLLTQVQFHPDTDQIIKDACQNYKGVLTTLESAVGAFIIGQIYGWRVLRIVHGSNTYIRYERLLGENFKFKDYCKAKGVLGRRSVGLSLAEKINSFWKVATGKYKEDKDLKEIED